MQNLTPVSRDARPALPDFTPVPRRYRHDGWTPERQKAFIEALADTGSVSRAAGLVNMASANCYALRRAPGAEELRRAWDAALDFGVARLKDIAFERAIEGELIPVFVAGKLMGFRRKRNDHLLMFCLRHYGQDAAGKRTTINHFSTRASAGVATVDGGSASTESIAEASTTTMRTVIAGDGCAAPGDAARDAARDDALARTLTAFEGVALDLTAQTAITAALEACAARRRATDAAIDAGGEDAADVVEDDPDESYVPLPLNGCEYRGELIPAIAIDDVEPFVAGEAHWSLAGADIPAHFLPTERAPVTEPDGVAAVRTRKRKPGWKKKVAGGAPDATPPDPLTGTCR